MTDADLSFRMQTFIEATPDQVWRALTEADLAALWWNPLSEADWRPGGRVLQTVTPGVTIECLVLEVERPSRLVYTFECDAYPDHPRSTVTWELEEVAGGCLLRLVHTGFPRPDLGLSDVSRHWPTLLAGLKRLLEEDSRFGAEGGAS